MTSKRYRTPAPAVPNQAVETIAGVARTRPSTGDPWTSDRRDVTLVAPIVDWFDHNKRELPWREPGVGAWRVLVSEVMLQQTPVNRVLPAYREWVRRWPTPPQLAADSAGDAVRMWAKLGYPRRALRLHETAVILTREHGGEVPDDLDLLLRLPGVGAYTARAVLAFAYRRRAPVVDTNIRRVMARAVAGAAEPGPVSGARDLAAMEVLLPAVDADAARFCAAIMELGALVCVASGPRCEACPISNQCAWRLGGYPAYSGPAARSPGFAGTDRQVRGLLLDVLRASEHPVGRDALDVAWPRPPQRDRALASLLSDGLIELRADGRFALPS